MWLEYSGTFADFRKEGYSSPGILIEIMLNNKPKQFLIGDISELGAVMNKKEALFDHCQVIRYRVIWQRTKRRSI